MDTGAALINDRGIIMAIAQERVTREKHGGGIKESINYLLKANKLKLNEIDYFVVSICCDIPPTKDYVIRILADEGIKIKKNKIIINESHHMSHAATAYYTSGFDEALIYIADGEGNILNPIEFEFHANSIERTTYYIGKGNKIKLISRDADEPGDLGQGMCYGYFTQWIGYPNYQSSGKTMGLAPYGNKKRFEKVKIFYLNKDKIYSYLEPNITRTLSVRRLIFKQTGKEIGINSLESTKNPSQL